MSQLFGGESFPPHLTLSIPLLYLPKQKLHESKRLDDPGHTGEDYALFNRCLGRENHRTEDAEEAYR